MDAERTHGCLLRSRTRLFSAACSQRQIPADAHTAAGSSIAAAALPADSDVAVSTAAKMPAAAAPAAAQLRSRHRQLQRQAAAELPRTPPRRRLPMNQPRRHQHQHSHRLRLLWKPQAMPLTPSRTPEAWVPLQPPQVQVGVRLLPPLPMLVAEALLRSPPPRQLQLPPRLRLQHSCSYIRVRPVRG